MIIELLNPEKTAPHSYLHKTVDPESFGEEIVTWIQIALNSNIIQDFLFDDGAEELEIGHWDSITTKRVCLRPSQWIIVYPDRNAYFNSFWDAVNQIGEDILVQLNN